MTKINMKAVINNYCDVPKYLIFLSFQLNDPTIPTKTKSFRKINILIISSHKIIFGKFYKIY